jgi:sigma-B regulation protein RsbU (phosphoserine phosphatase)
MLVRAIKGAKAHTVGQTTGASIEKRTRKTRVADESEYGAVSELKTGGPIIGAFPFSAYQQETIQMQSGDLLLAYTDGVTEAFNSFGEEFSEERLRQIVASSSHLSADALTAKIIQSVNEWCVETPQHDDLTLVVMKVK